MRRKVIGSRLGRSKVHCSGAVFPHAEDMLLTGMCIELKQEWLRARAYLCRAENRYAYKSGFVWDEASSKQS